MRKFLFVAAIATQGTSAHAEPARSPVLASSAAAPATAPATPVAPVAPVAVATPPATATTEKPRKTSSTENRIRAELRRHGIR